MLNPFDLKKYSSTQIPARIHSADSEGSGGGGSILKTILILAAVAAVGIFIMTSSIAGAWGVKAKGTLQNSGVGNALLNIESSISEKVGGFAETITQNPWEETKTTTAQTATETAVASGLYLIADNWRDPGIVLLPSQPRSGENLIVRVGIKNPTKDFIANQTFVRIENLGEIGAQTGLQFANSASPNISVEFNWTKCGNGLGTQKCSIMPGEYAVAELISTNGAKQIAKENISQTAVNIMTTVTYAFGSKRGWGMPMNEFTFTMRPEATLASEVDAWEKTLVQRKAGGVLDVSLDNRAGFDWDSKMYLDYSIKNVGGDSAMAEEVRFAADFDTPTTGLENLIAFTIPTDFSTTTGSDAGISATDIEDLNNKNYTCKAYTDRVTCWFKPGTLFKNALNENKSIAETESQDFSLKLKAPSKTSARIGKQYTISVYFLEGAYRFRGTNLKDTAVKP